MQNTFERLKALPVLGALIKFADERPRLAAWIVLSLGIVILLMIEARDVGLLIGQWVALIVASVLVAGLCIWIVTWEDGDDASTDSESPKTKDAPAAEAASATPSTEETKAS